MKTQKAYSEGSGKPDLARFCRLCTLYDACLENARALQHEAEHLLAGGFTARAFALAYTGWEEVGKAQLVADFANRMISEGEFQAAFRKHDLKVAYNYRKFVLNPDDLQKSTIEYDEKAARRLFDGRQRALYVDKTESDVPRKPSEEISREEADHTIAALRKELDDIRMFDGMNERIGSASFLK